MGNLMTRNGVRREFEDFWRHDPFADVFESFNVDARPGVMTGKIAPRRLEYEQEIDEGGVNLTVNVAGIESEKINVEITTGDLLKISYSTRSGSQVSESFRIENQYDVIKTSAKTRLGLLSIRIPKKVPGKTGIVKIPVEIG